MNFSNLQRIDSIEMKMEVDSNNKNIHPKRQGNNDGYNSFSVGSSVSLILVYMHLSYMVMVHVNRLPVCVCVIIHICNCI